MRGLFKKPQLHAIGAHTGTTELPST